MDQTQTKVLDRDLDLSRHRDRLVFISMQEYQVAKLNQDGILLHYQLLHIPFSGQATENFALYL